MTIGVLLVNLGTPDSPDRRDVRRYLNEFLTDGRVIDLPWLPRQLLVRGMIVPKRYRESARNYEEIWTERGSPLIVYGRKVAARLQETLGEDYTVELAMRYQNPSIASALEALRDSEEIIVLPLFPQYASATTGSIHQRVLEIVSKWQVIPPLRLISSYPTQERMIATYADLAFRFNPKSYDHILMSFHGLPERHIRKADCHNWCLKENCCARLGHKNRNCYSAQCHATARAIAAKLDLTPDDYTVCFQSRLGRDPWLKPYLSEILKSCEKRILVLCPAFVADCVETLHEIGVEYTDTFLATGGEELTLVPSLNDEPEWILCLRDLVHANVRLGSSPNLTLATDAHHQAINS